MKLMLDGKEIGEVKDGKLVGGTEPQPNKRETMNVPAVRLTQDDEPLEEEDDNEGEESDERTDDNDASESSDDTEFEEYLKTLDPKAREFVLNLVESNTTLSKKVDRLLNQREPQSRTTRDDDIDVIGDIPADKDPFGVARTLKNVVKYMRSVDEKVSRLDSHTGFKEAQHILDDAKSKQKIFKDPSTKAVAETLLEAELKTNKTDTIEDIVVGVARKVKQLGLSSAKTYIKDKAGKVNKLPAATLRNGDGTTPAITVQKPRNLREAGEAYRAWKTQNARLNRRG